MASKMLQRTRRRSLTSLAEESYLPEADRIMTRRPRAYSSPGLPFPLPDDLPKVHKSVSPNTSPIHIPSIRSIVERKLEEYSLFEAARQYLYLRIIVRYIVHLTLYYAQDLPVFLEEVIDHVEDYMYFYSNKEALHADVLNDHLELSHLISKIHAQAQELVSDEEANEICLLPEEHPLTDFIIGLVDLRITDVIRPMIQRGARYGFRIEVRNGKRRMRGFYPREGEEPQEGQKFFEEKAVLRAAGQTVAIDAYKNVPGLIVRDEVRLGRISLPLHLVPSKEGEGECSICFSAVGTTRSHYSGM